MGLQSTHINTMPNSKLVNALVSRGMSKEQAEAIEKELTWSPATRADLDVAVQLIKMEIRLSVLKWGSLIVAYGLVITVIVAAIALKVLR